MSPEKRSVQNIIKCTYCDDATRETDVLAFSISLRWSYGVPMKIFTHIHRPVIFHENAKKRTKIKRSKKTPFVTNEGDKTKRPVEINIARKQRLCHDMITR